MEPSVLADKDQYPSEEIIYSHIGKSKLLWLSFFSYIHENHPDISEEWRYYNDGKSWLMKTQRKSKTVFWLKIYRDTFSTTFYLPDRAKKIILDSDISGKLKNQYRDKLKNSKIHGITITYKNKKDIDDAKKMLNIKLSFK